MAEELQQLLEKIQRDGVEKANAEAKAIVEKAKAAGVKLTPAGAMYPYGYDPEDSAIRIAPTYPSLDDLKLAAELFCCCAKLAALEAILAA